MGSKYARFGALPFLLPFESQREGFKLSRFPYLVLCLCGFECMGPYWYMVYSGFVGTPDEGTIIPSPNDKHPKHLVEKMVLNICALFL